MSHFRRKKLLALQLCLLLLPRAAVSGQTAAPPEPLKALDAYVEKGLSAWRLPGLAVAVVKDDKVIFARGYGVREVGKAERVDEGTLFAVGSVTKSFTAAAVGLMVDEKKMAWDDPAVKYLPSFQLYDASLTNQVTLRDLLSHRTGLPRANASLLIGYDRAETARRMRYLKPAAGLRSQFTYNNHMYLFAGLALEAAAGTGWDEFVRKRLFAPLNMTASNTSVSALNQGANVAQPHASIQDQLRPLPYRSIDSHAPAGAVNSNVLDMSNWVRMFLNKGSFEGRQVLSPQVVRALQSQQTVIPVGPLSEKLFPSTHFQGYGMGWFVRDYRGRKVVEHGGNVDGMSAQVGMLPEEGLGVVILSNRDSSPFPLALMYRVFDAFLGDADRQTDLSAEYLKLTTEGAEQARAREKEAAGKRAAGTKPTLPPEGYAGAYANDLYGEASVTVKGGSLYVKFNEAAQGELEHWEKDTFRIAWTNPLYVEAVGKTLLTFQLDGGKVSEMKAQNLADYKRVAPGGGD